MSFLTFWRKVKEFFAVIIKAFIFKDGEVSKTAILLSIAGLVLVTLWPFQSLFAGVCFFGWWTIPVFDPGAAASVITTLSGLYLLNHSKFMRGSIEEAKDLVETKEKLDLVVDKLLRKDSGNE